MSPPLLLHFTGKPSRPSEWGRCHACVTWYTENRPAILAAGADFASRRGLSETEALDACMRGRHAKH